MSVRENVIKLEIFNSIKEIQLQNIHSVLVAENASTLDKSHEDKDEQLKNK